VKSDYEKWRYFFVSSVKPFTQPVYGGSGGKSHPTGNGVSESAAITASQPPAWEGRAIATHKLCLVEFSAFMDLQQDPDTVSPVSTRQFSSPIAPHFQLRRSHVPLHLARLRKVKGWWWGYENYSLVSMSPYEIESNVRHERLGMRMTLNDYKA